MKKFLAFTLAETLIVMGIIGIVSALTLPNLNSSTGEKEKIAKVKKIYQNLDDAIGRATAVYGPVNEWFANDNSYSAQVTRFGDRITEFMKVSKNCGVTTNQRCFSNQQIKNLAGNYGNADDFDTKDYAYKFQVADGTSFAIARSSNYGSNAVFVYFNIDGNKGKNVIGNDVFSLNYSMVDNMLIVKSEPDFSTLTSTGYGEEATGWVITFDNMDYLKAGTDGKCKDNTSITLSATANPPVISCK